MAAESSTPAHFRENIRAPLQVPATLQLDAFSEPLTGYTANVSEGGMFVLMHSQPAVGSIVKFELELSNPARTISGTAEVVWLRTEARGPEQPAGAGLQFRYIEDDDAGVLRSAVRELIEQLGPEPESPPPRKRKARNPQSPRSADPAKSDQSRHQKAKENKKKIKKKGPAKKPKTADDSKTILGMPAEKAKLIFLIILMAVLLLSFLL